MIIFIGYIVSYSYVFLLIFGLGSLIKHFSNNEISRKVIHICLFALWIFIDLFFKGTINQFILPCTFIIFNVLSFKFKIFKSVERDNKKDFGTIFFAVSVSIIYIVSFFFPDAYLFTFYAVASLTFGDGFAGAFGNVIKSKKIHNSKSLVGFIACVLTTFMAYLIFYLLGNKALPIWFLLVLSTATGIFELVDFGIDNLLITLGIFGLSYSSYLYGFNFQLSILFSLLIVLLVFFTKAISYYGSLLSGIYVFCFSFFGGLFPFIYLLMLYFLSVICGLVKKSFNKNDEITKKQNKKDLNQIFCNGFIPTIILIVSFVFKDNILLMISLCSLSANFIDSLSSDIGSISRSNPYDFIKRKHVQKGLSGGVTFLGTSAAFFASLLLSVIIVYHYNFSFLSFIFSFISIFSGTIIDSVLGSTLQNKNICTKCHLITEKDYHCDTKCNHYSGLKWINNDAVNFISSFLASLLGMLMKVVL